MNSFGASGLTIKTQQRNTCKFLLIYLLIWFLVNLVQAIFTPINADEAYYAMYGEHLAWGYFDHPPVVAVMAFLSSHLFGGTLGVRFFTIIFQIITILIVWKLANEISNRQNIHLFFIILASFVMFEAYGFITTPDSPLLLFTALFLWIYNAFLKKQSTQNTLLLGIVMAGMMYSKYHAVLVIGFTILSNLKLLKKHQFWLAGLLALVLLMPHFLWQVHADFPSLKYHLISRSSPFKWGHFFEYWPNQLATFNPFTLGAFFYVIFKTKPKSQFEKTLYFISIGFLLFFWLMTFKGHVEPHWTVAATIAMALLIYNRALEMESLKKYVKRFVFPSIFLILIVRIVLVAGLVHIPNFYTSKDYKAVEKVAKDLPVVYLGSFQDPSVYHFYTGEPSFTLSSVFVRHTQFDIWQKELNYFDKPAFIMQDNQERAQHYDIDGYKFTGYKVNHLQTTNRVKVTFSMDKTVYAKGDTLIISMTLFSAHYPIDFNHKELPVSIKTFYMKGHETYLSDGHFDVPIDVLPADTIVHKTMKTVVPTDMPDGEYKFGIGLANPLNIPINSNVVKLKIE